MKLRELYRAEDAASPVVGVILIIGVVVILAAGIGGTLVSTLDTSEPAPSANYEDEQGEQLVVADGGNNADFTTLTIRHDSGEQLNNTQLGVTVNGEKAWGVYEAGDCGLGSLDCDRTVELFDGNGAFETGDSVTVVTKDHPELSEDTGFTIDEDDVDLVPTGTDRDNPDNHIHLEPEDSVRLIWYSEDRESSQTLYETEVSATI